MIPLASQRAELEFDLDHPEKVQSSVAPDLSDSGRVVFDTWMDDGLNVSVEADSLGSMRGALNTVMRLVKLSEKFMGDIDE